MGDMGSMSISITPVVFGDTQDMSGVLSVMDQITEVVQDHFIYTDYIFQLGWLCSWWLNPPISNLFRELVLPVGPKSISNSCRVLCFFLMPWPN